MQKAKILIIDIETAPSMGYVWGMFKQNLSLDMLQQNSYLLSFAAKWLGEEHVIYRQNRNSSRDGMLVRQLIRLLDKADIVIAHNAKKFDIPVINGRALVHGITPPSPYKVIDTLVTAKRQFRFISNKLEHLADILGCSPKLAHSKFPGFRLWEECLAQNDEAWEEMRTYNIQDVLTLEEVYLKMRPWMVSHPNMGVFEEKDRPVCPKCGGEHVHFRGYVTTNTQKYRKFKCTDCGGWSRTRFTEYPKDKRKSLIVNAGGGV